MGGSELMLQARTVMQRSCSGWLRILYPEGKRSRRRANCVFLWSFSLCRRVKVVSPSVPKAKAPKRKGRRRWRTWISSAQLPCSTPTTSATTPPPAWSCGAFPGLAPPKRRARNESKRVAGEQSTRWKPSSPVKKRLFWVLLLLTSPEVSSNTLP